MDPAHVADTAASRSMSTSPPGLAPSLAGSLEDDRDSLTLSHRPRHTRTSTPKVRTGCVTCKKRHIKCDEAKPHCMNCLKTRGVCDGYVVKPRKTRSSKAAGGQQPRRLDPQTPCRRRVLLREPDVHSLDFDNDMQSVYFDDWNELVKVSLGGARFNQTKLWTTTMPQLTRQKPALRHAAMSIGAISRALSQTSYVVVRNFDNIASLLQSQHYQSAVTHYCQALRLQGQADFQTASIQEAVLLSILFVAFEALRGNRHSALQHVRYGFVLLQELLTCEDSDARVWQLAPDPRQLITEVLDLYNHLDVQSRTVLSGDVKSSRSPAYELIRGLKARGHTIETYNMQIQRYTEQPGEGRRGSSSLPPDVFGSGEEAYAWWQVCQRRIAKLGPLLLTVVDDLRLHEVRDEQGVDRILERMQHQPELLAFCARSTEHLAQWRAAFEPLYNRTLADKSVSRKEYLKVLHLRMHFLIMTIYNYFPKYADEATIASLTPHCREINDVIEILLSEQEKEMRSPAHVFSMEFGIAWQLTVVGLTCRDPLVRDNATRILERYPRREGLWDSRAFLAVLLKNRELESDNAREGTPAEQWRRLCRREFIFEDAGGTVVFRSLKRDAAATGGWDLVEEAAEFRGRAEGLVWKTRPLSGGGFMRSANNDEHPTVMGAPPASVA